MLAIAGKYPADGAYVDGRFGDNNAAGDLSANLGRMPILSVAEGSVGQSTAINFYVASETGLLGSSSLEAAQIIAITEHLKELMTAWRALVPYGTEPSAEKLDQWFTQGATDSEGVADRAGYATRYAKWFVGRIENTLGSTGFAVGNKLSLADVSLYNTFAEVMTDAEAPAETPQWKKECFGSKARVEELLKSSPKIQASINAVASNANFQKWLSVRGPQGF
jgi:glutathione S-transferase